MSWGKGKQNGPAGNRNAGVKRQVVSGLFFLDDDCIATSRYLESYLDAIMNFTDISVFEGIFFQIVHKKHGQKVVPQMIVVEQAEL